jgi:serine/threonine-protein kinase
MVKTKKPLILKLDRLIEENLSDSSFTIDWLSKSLGLSRSQLHRLIKDRANLSTSLYIRQKRLEKAKELLSETDVRISEVAYQIGIDIPQNFSKYFTESFSISPSNYRKESRINSETKQEGEHSIAVLPFVNLSADAKQEYFSDGITEAIINVLAKVKPLKVAGRTTSFRFKGKSPDVQELGTLLNVNYILEGSVRSAGSKIRVSAQLVDVKDGFQVWSETYDRFIVDVFDIQDEISLAILDEIKIMILGTEKDLILKRSVDNMAAYQLYLQGRFYHYQFKTEDVFLKAIKLYKAAIKLAPEYANAYAGIAHCYVHLWFFSDFPPEKSVMLSKLALNRALEIDPNNADCHNADGEIKLWYDWDFKEAKTAFDKALALDPNLPEIYMHYGMYSAHLGNFDVCDSFFSKAIELDPYAEVYYSNWGLMKWMKGDLEEGMKLADIAIFKENDFWGGHFLKALIHLELKQYDEALTSAIKASILYPCGNSKALLALTHIFLGSLKEAQILIKQIEEKVANGFACNYDLGQLYVATGEFMKAYQSFEKAQDLHEGRMLMIHQAFRRARYFKESPEFKKFFDTIDHLSIGI